MFIFFLRFCKVIGYIYKRLWYFGFDDRDFFVYWISVVRVGDNVLDYEGFVLVIS